jgi:hypothetical protein
MDFPRAKDSRFLLEKFTALVAFNLFTQGSAEFYSSWSSLLENGAYGRVRAHAFLCT